MFILSGFMVWFQGHTFWSRLTLFLSMFVFKNLFISVWLRFCMVTRGKIVGSLAAVLAYLFPLIPMWRKQNDFCGDLKLRLGALKCKKMWCCIAEQLPRLTVNQNKCVFSSFLCGCFNSFLDSNCLCCVYRSVIW